MKKFFELLKENKWMHYSIIVIVGIILSIPLKNIEIRETHDGFFHLLRLLGTYNTISIGQIPPIIVPDFCSGMGYAINLFYPQLVTYIPLLFKFITPSYAIALKVFGGVSIVLSGITMYNFVYQVTKKRTIALFSAIFYLIAPYKLGNVYKRYAIGEFVALIFLPMLFQGMHSLFNEDGKKHYYIAIGTSLLILSHTITTLYAAMFCAIYIIFHIQKLKDKNVIKKIIINLIFIILLTLLFTLPMLEAKQSAEYTIFNDSVMRTTNQWTYDHSLQLSEFFKDIGKNNATTYIIGIPVLLAILLSFYTIKKVDTKYKDIYIIFALLSFVSLYIATKYFPWQIIPSIFCKLQYPWRLVGFFNFFSSLICGINLYILINKFVKKDYLKILILLIILVTSLSYTLSIVNQYKATDSQLDEKYESEILDNPKINHMRINRDYLPLNALYLQSTYMKTKENKTDILEGQAQISNEVKENLNLSMDIKNATKGTILEFPYIYYPGYEVIIYIGDNIQTIKPIESEHGYLALELTENIEQGEIIVEYKGTTITKVSYIVSFVSLIIFIIYIYLEKKRGEKHV